MQYTFFRVFIYYLQEATNNMYTNYKTTHCLFQVYVYMYLYIVPNCIYSVFMVWKMANTQIQYTYIGTCLPILCIYCVLLASYVFDIGNFSCSKVRVTFE